MEGNSKKPPLFGWADTPWTVAALLGAWGVMIGIEEFFLADVFMVLAGLACTWRLANDCFQHRRRRWIPFVLWLAIIATVVGVDIHLTATKKASSEARAGEIPKLNTQIGDLKTTIEAQSTELSNAQGHTDQHVSDIQEENKRLRASIDKKDAALVSIAKQQYDLNFAPQVAVINVGVPDTVQITNNGKSAINLLEVHERGELQALMSTPQSIVQGASSGMKLTAEEKTRITSLATKNDATNDYRTSMECSVLIETRNNKRYLIPFTWTFIIKDGVIASSFATDHPIVEQPGTHPQK